MKYPMRFVTAIILALTNGCSEVAAQNPQQISRLAQQISVFQSDPKIVAFLAGEAARAGVSSIEPVPERGVPIAGMHIFIEYGMTTSSRKIYLNANNSGARSVVNIAHEIAHASTLTQTCGGHTSRWLHAYGEIALRFEAQFPGVKWSGTTPTLRVEQNKARYAIGTRCP